jgi:hypothetical protein
LVDREDIEHYFFYIVLQPVNDGLVDDIREYPGYNCFEDAVTGTTRQYKRKGKLALGAEKLKEVTPGQRPRKTKTSGPKDHRPRVLAIEAWRRDAGNAWYFPIQFEYKEASASYRAGNLDVKFPEGTYKPPLFTVARNGTIV